MKRAIFLLLIASCLTGCNWMRLLAFRSQLKQLSEYARWESHEWGQTMVFSQPLLQLADLNSLGLAPAKIQTDLYAIKYRYHVVSVGTEGDAEMLFLMDQGRLSGIVFPKIIMEMIGRDNLEVFLRRVGGESSSEPGIRAVEKGKVLQAVFGSSVPPVAHHKIGITFTPKDGANMMMEIVFEEGSKPGAYSKLSLSIGRGGAPRSGSGAK